MTQRPGSSRVRSPTGPWVRVLSLVAIFMVAHLANAREARADATFDLALKGLASTSTDAVTHAIETLGASEDPRAFKILQGLNDGNVVISDDGGIYIKESSGALRDAATDAPASPPSAHPMVVDDQIRRVLAPLMAQLRAALHGPEAPARGRRGAGGPREPGRRDRAP